MIIKKQIHTNLLIFGILFLLITVFVIFPQIKKLSSISDNLVMQKNLLNLFQNQIKNLETFEQNYLLHKPTLERIENSFVIPEEPVNFIEFLENEAQNSNLEIILFPLSIIPGEIDLWENTGFKIKTTGTFSDSLRFLAKIEASPFLIEIFQLNIQKINEKTKVREFENFSVGDVIYDISLKAFSKELIGN